MAAAEPPAPPQDEQPLAPPPPAAEQMSAAPEPSQSAPPPPATPEPSPPQTAALPPADLDEGALRLAFAETSAELSEQAKGELKALAGELIKDGNARVQLLAYASSADDSASRARRLSLSRALAVRAYLIDQGVRSTRMDVRALGNKSEGGPPDRVDILPARR